MAQELREMASREGVEGGRRGCASGAHKLDYRRAGRVGRHSPLLLCLSRLGGMGLAGTVPWRRIVNTGGHPQRICMAAHGCPYACD